MLFNDAYQAVIFRVPKVASQAMGTALRPLGFYQHKSSDPKIWGADRLKAMSYITRMSRCKPEVLQYKRAAFVRHPEDRLFSAWRYINKFAKKIREGQLPFDQFVDRVLAGDNLHLGSLWHAGLSQTRLLAENGQLQVDFVGRYEQLDEDFAKWCKWCGIREVRLPRTNCSGPAVDYHDFYPRGLRARVREHFAEDYETFGYQ